MRVELEVEEAVLESCAQVTYEPPGRITVDTPLADLALDSLGYADLAVALDERFGIRLADTDLGAFRTVADLAATVRAEMRANRPRIPAGTGKYQLVGKALAGWFIRLYCRMKVRGTGHVPATGPVIIAANHRSMWDVPIHVIACPRPVTFMAKRELFKGPVLSWAWRVLGGFPVRREISDIRAIDTGLAVLERGEVLGLYPEGTRSLSGEMLPFLKGAAWIALRTGVPIVPCGLKGTGRRPPEGKPLIGKRVEVNFGPPLPIEREDDPGVRKEKAEALTAQLLDAITGLAT
ncbi:MAG TPA: 1-acyl-sn-glycerol-3-phosphate acyltransferase [Actinomycetota bacterium]